MRILLVDDHVLLGEALTVLIETQHPDTTVHRATTLAQALLALAEPLDLVLLDLGLPDATGLQALSAVRERAPQLRVVVMSADDRLETVRSAIDLGAAGFVPKRADSHTLMRALQLTLEGAVSLPAALMDSDAQVGTDPGLSPRQRDVLRLLIEGQPNKLIGRSLGVSESTVKTHIEAIFERLGVNNRTQAVMAAARLQLRLNQ